MELLTALAIVTGLALVALVFMLVVVVLGGDDIKPFKQFPDVKLTCPYCAGKLIPFLDYSVPNSVERGLLECPTCKIPFKHYRTQSGLNVLEEVFGTPLPIDPRDEK